MLSTFFNFVEKSDKLSDFAVLPSFMRVLFLSSLTGGPTTMTHPDGERGPVSTGQPGYYYCVINWIPFLLIFLALLTARR